MKPKAVPVNADVCDNLRESREKNKGPMSGSEAFHHVTASSANEPKTCPPTKTQENNSNTIEEIYSSSDPNNNEATINLSDSEEIYNKEANSELKPDDINTCKGKRNVNSSSNEKNNAYVWGSKQFRHVTVTRSHERKDEQSDDQDSFEYTVKQIVEKLKQANGSQIAFSSALQSVYYQEEKVKTYLGNNLTSRGNRKVRNIAVAVLRHENIDPVKYKPQLVLRWKSPEPS